MLGGMWGSVILPAFVAALIVAGTIFSEVRQHTFAALPKEVQAAKIAVAALGVSAPLLAMRNAVRAKRAKLNADASAALLATLAKVAGTTKVSAESVGIHAYLVRRRFPWLCNAKQERIARVRLSSHPPPSTIEWTRGKGFIGACWADDAWADFEFDRIYGAHANCASEEEWAKVPPKLRFGLSYQEWNNSKVHRLVRVYPIHAKQSRGRHRYAGCIALDTTHEESVKPLLADDVRACMAEAAQTIAVALSKDG